MDLQIDGIYDQRTIKCLQDEGIRRFVFDFRPTSFNFFQQHRFFDLLQQCYRVDCQYLLHFCNEADYVIQKFIDDISKLNLPSFHHSFRLLFSDNRSADFYDQFNMPYELLYQRILPHDIWKESRNICGIVYPFDFLNDLHLSNGIMPFVQNFFHLLPSHNFTQTLNVDWDSNLFPSLFSYLDFDYLSYPINSKIEVCYRNVDLPKLKKQLQICKNNL